MAIIPKHANEKTRMKAALKIATQLKSECHTEGDISEIAADLVKHCKYGDGFQMARELEKYAYWECNMQIAEILDGFSSEIESAHKMFLVEWQAENHVPALPAQTQVKTKHGTGIIDGLYGYRPLTYCIKIDGDKDCEEPKNKRFLLYFDEVEAA